MIVRIISATKISTNHRKHSTNNYNKPNNFNTIMIQIDKSLNMTKPPAIEYIWTAPPWITLNISKWNSETTSNPYGHSCVRYTLSNGEQWIMNIWGNRKTNPEMVHFISPVEYLFGNPSETIIQGSEQGGIVNRNFIGLRIEDWPSEKIDIMHQFFLKLKDNHKAQTVQFSLLFPAVYNFLRKFFPFLIPKSGNCAVWTSMGMKKAGLIDWVTMFPKVIILRTFWDLVLKHKLSLVSYQCVNNRQSSGGLISPLNLWRRRFKEFNIKSLWNLATFCDVHVKYSKEKNIIMIKQNDGWRKLVPSYLKNKIPI